MRIGKLLDCNNEVLDESKIVQEASKQPDGKNRILIFSNGQALGM